jgi:hypothetical protein
MKSCSLCKKLFTLLTKMSCERQTTKKYTSRPGPPWPAAECIGQVKRGNDERMYIARSYPSGAKRWVLETSKAKTGAGQQRAIAAAKAAKEKLPFTHAIVNFSLGEEVPDNYHRKGLDRTPTTKELKVFFERNVKGTLEYGFGASAIPIKFHDGKITMRIIFPEDKKAREEFIHGFRGIMSSFDDDSNMSIQDKKTGHWYQWYSRLEKTY